MRPIVLTLLCFLCFDFVHANDRDDLHKKSIGTKVKDQFVLGNKVFFLPEGEWTLIAINEAPAFDTRFQAEAARFGSVFLVDVSDGKLVRAVWAHATVMSAAYPWGTSVDPCKKQEGIHLDKQMGRGSEDQFCLRVSHTVGLLSGSRGWFQAAERWIIDNKVRLSRTHLYVEFAKLHFRELAQMRYYFDPEAYGFSPAKGNAWSTSDWHRDNISKDSRRVGYVEELMKWGDKVSPYVLGGFTNDRRFVAEIWRVPFPRAGEPRKPAIEVTGPDGSTAAVASAPSGQVMAPVWQVGDEWQYAYKSPSDSGTFVWNVTRIESLDGVPHYVIKTGAREIFYRVSDLASSLERVDGVLVRRDTPSRLSYAWPLTVGKSWEQSYRRERPADRTTTDRNSLYTVDVEETVTVPAGTFRTLKITWRNKNTNAVYYEMWYAPDVKQWVKIREVLSSGIRERELIAFKLKQP